MPSSLFPKFLCTNPLSLSSKYINKGLVNLSAGFSAGVLIEYAITFPLIWATGISFSKFPLSLKEDYLSL